VKIVTFLGTRPEIIRLRCVIDTLDSTTDHILVHTGQNFDDRLSQLFFTELSLRAPDRHLGVRATTFGDQLSQIVAAGAVLLQEERPDAVLVLGDTNSGLISIVARRMGIAVYHMEAGNRCFDDRVPEELNRRIIDHSSSVLLPYTHRSKENLLAEGIDRSRIFVTGNPIREVLVRYRDRIRESSALANHGVSAHEYFLATVHRAETVDVPERLGSLVEALDQVAGRWGMPVVCSLHPRTKDRMTTLGIGAKRVKFVDPLGLFDFVALERSARCVLTDSGTVQEECCIAGVPTVTLRSVTERPETLECGSNILAGVETESVITCTGVALSKRSWIPPWEYMVEDVSAVVANIILGL
jgi:UDP-N-acetylglucosamine 2-epimerase (non-hydrolysing)